MKLKISDEAAAPLAFVAAATRIFYGVILEMPELYNSGWLAALVGGALALPFAFAADRLFHRREISVAGALESGGQTALLRVLCALLALPLLFDAAVVARGVCSSASYMSLYAIGTPILLASQMGMCLWCAQLGGDAIGFSARLWTRVLFCLLAIVVLFQIPTLRPAWITPILGPGIPALLDGALRVSGWLSLLLGVFLISERNPDRNGSRFSPVRTVSLAALTAAVMLALRGMLTPALVGGNLTSGFFHLDTLLSNGRTPLSLQLPLTIIWFIGLFMLLLYDTFLCAAMLQTFCTKLPRFVVCLISATAAGLLAFSGISSLANSLRVFSWMYVFHGALALVLLIFTPKDNGGTTHA